MNQDSPDRILIVDDDPEIRRLLVDYLAKNGFEAIPARDGREMVQMLDRHAIDLVVLDLNLPDADGLTLCCDLRARSNLPVLMLTARGEEADRIVGIEMGADDYLVKPFSPRELVARIKAVLRRTRALLHSLVADEQALGLPVTLAAAPVVPVAPYVGLLSALKRALANLIDNAVKYGHEAQVFACDDAGVLRLDVADRGPGIAAADLARVLEPYCGWKARAAAPHHCYARLSVADHARRHHPEIELLGSFAPEAFPRPAETRYAKMSLCLELVALGEILRHDQKQGHLNTRIQNCVVCEGGAEGGH